MATEIKAERAKRYVKHKPEGRAVLKTSEVSNPDETKPIVLRASLVLPTGEMLLVDKANKDIKLVDENFNCVATLKFDTFPFDICASNRKQHEYYVTEPEMHSVHLIHAGKSRMTRIKQTCIDEDCRGIVCWESGVAVTVMRDGPYGILGLMDYDFRIQKKVWRSDLHKTLFRAPWYMVAIKGGSQIAISDQGNNSLICVDVKTLGIIFIFKHDQLIGPRSLASDDDGNIFVIGSCERCHNVVKISSEGKFKCIFLSRKDKLNYPSGIAYNKSDKTIILQRNKDIPKFSAYSTLQ